MRGMMMVWIAGAVATPVGIGAVYSAADGEGDLFERAQQIAMEQFSVNATLTVQDLYSTPTRLGAFGETIRADRGYHFVHARILIENTGKVDVAPATHQFSAVDEIGSETTPELDAPHHDFDASRLRKGGARQGEVIFELRKDAVVGSIFWQGDLGNATGAAPPLRFPHP